MQKELKKESNTKENKHTIVPALVTTNIKQPVLIPASLTKIRTAGGEQRSPWQMIGRVL